MPLALFALTIGAFAIGTTEFVIVGLVPTIAQQLSISLLRRDCWSLSTRWAWRSAPRY